MIPMYQTAVPTSYGGKEIAVYHCNILDFDQPVDILTTSASCRAYYPTPRSLFGALQQINISVEHLAQHPQFDLRSPCNVWLSEQIHPGIPDYGSSRDPRISRPWLGRIGCIEMCYSYTTPYSRQVAEAELLNSIQAYFRMLDIASLYNVPVGTVAMPLLGAGVQHISSSLTVFPLINECLEFLQRNQKVQRILFIEYSYANAAAIVQALQQVCDRTSLPLRSRMPEPVRHPAPPTTQPYFFISYNSADQAVADKLYGILQQKGIQVWYAPNDAHDVYAGEIYNAIQKATHFLVILSENSKKSYHVLVEIVQAFNRLSQGIKIKPLCIDHSPDEPSMEYYLAAQHKYFTNGTSYPQLTAVVDQILHHL